MVMSILQQLTLNDNTQPGSTIAPAFKWTPSQTKELLTLHPSSIMTLSHTYEPLIKTFFPILQPSPITEFNTLQWSPMLVALPTTEFAPICAECDNVTSVKKNAQLRCTQNTEINYQKNSRNKFLFLMYKKLGARHDWKHGRQPKIQAKRLLIKYRIHFNNRMQNPF